MGQVKPWVGLLAVLFWATSCVCFAQDQDAWVRSRLKEMKGDDDPVAQVAEMEIRAMGEKAIEPLKKIMDAEKDPERGEAAKVYPAALEAAGRLTRVSLDFENAKLAEVVESLNSQCKAVKIDASHSGSFPRVTIHREKAPYSLALAEICLMGDGRLSEDDLAFITIWREPGSGSRPISEDWGNMVILDRINWQSTLSYDNMKRDGPNLELQFKLIMDPAMPSIIGGAYKDVVAENEAGKPLTFLNKRNNLEPDHMPWGTVRTRSLYLSAPQGSKKIARLKGKMKEFICQGMESWEVGDIHKAGGTSHEFGSLKVEIQSIKQTGDALEIRASLSGVPKPSDLGIPDDQNNLVFNHLLRGVFKVESEDKKDSWYLYMTSFNKVGKMAGSELYQGDFTIQMRNSYDKTDDKLKLTVRMPTKFQEVWIGFEFKDIELF